jgi:DNA-binding transcriptional regulator YdaS (Cro superfamily)
MTTGIDLAVQAAENNQSELARRLGIRPQSVQQWVQARRIPAERVVDVEKATGVPRSLLRPDLYAD